MHHSAQKVRPRDGWVVVLADQRKNKLDSGLILPDVETGAEKVTEGAGELIRVGIGEKNRTLGLEPGMRVVFRGYLKWANRIDTEDTWVDGDRKHYFIMSSDDLLGIIPPMTEVGVFSGRPQVPEKK